MNDNEFLESYLKDLASTLEPNDQIVEKLIKVRDLLVSATKKKNKILIFGNGGSAAIASHFSVDLTKNANLRAMNFNEADLITCFANDYGFEHWVEKAVDFYGDAGDVLIVISSSGSSKNMINAVKAARKCEFSSVITFSGFNNNNPLNQLGDVNLWIDSKAYNFVECIHQIWLLAIVDLIIGKREYSA